MPRILLWQPFIHLCGIRIGNRKEFFIILMPHFCVVAAFYMLLQKSSLFLCHIFCCGSLPYTFVAPEQEIESNLCHYDFQPFKHPSFQLLIFIYSTQLGHIKSSAFGLGHSFSLYHLKVLKTPRPSASDFHSRATPHSQAILMPPPPGGGNNVKYTSLNILPICLRRNTEVRLIS